MIKKGLAQRALELIRIRFADMLNASDHPTIWENWGPFALSRPIDSDAGYQHPERQLRPHGALSLVHTGGVLIAYVISTRILGVEPTAQGFSKCVIHPHMGDSKWAKGTFPSPRGDIQVEWNNEAGKLALRTELPQGVSAEVILDCDAKKMQTLSYNGEQYEVRSLERSPRRQIMVESKQIRVSIDAGTHNLELSGAPY